MQTVERTEEACAPARPDGAAQAAAEREEPGWLQLHREVKGDLSVSLLSVCAGEQRGLAAAHWMFSETEQQTRATTDGTWGGLNFLWNAENVAFKVTRPKTNRKNWSLLT